MPSFMTISPLAERSSQEEPRVGGACISLRDWLALSAFLLCVCTSLFGKDWRTAHLSPTEHTLTQRDRALLHSSWGICFSPGVLRERTGCPRCWMKQTGMKAGGQWMDRMNKWRASSGTRLTGLLCFCFFFFFFPFPPRCWHRACLTGRFWPSVLPANWSASKRTQRWGRGRSAPQTRFRASPSSFRHGAGLLQAGQTEETTSPR